MRLCRWVFLLSPLVLSEPLFGLGIRIADQDPFATARGNAFAATADNPSAIYYNPAGITQLDGLNLRAGLYAITLGSTYTAPNGTKHDTRDEFDALPQIYSTYALAGLPLSVGLGLYAPYGLGLEWPDDSGFRSLAKEGRIAYLTFNPVIAWKIDPTLSVAAGPTINYSQAELRRGIFFPGDEFRFKGDDVGFGYGLGILWQPHPKHSLGLSYRSETTLNYDGHATTSGVGPGIDGSQGATARFHFPRNIVGGWSFRPTTNWNFEVDADWTDWDSLNTVTLKNRSGGVIAPLPFNWRSSFFYEFGATYYLENNYRVSAGYIYSENSVPSSSFNPAVPDSNRHIFSVGLGKTYQRLRWDTAYQLAYGPARTVSGSPPNTNPFTGAVESANGRYEFISHALTVSLGYAF